MIKKAIIDSGVWIAAKHTSDQYYRKASKIVESWDENSIGFVFITNYILLETANFLLKKASFETAMEAIKMLTESERARVRYVDGLMHARIMEIFRQYKELSLADCSLIALAEEENIKEVYSFDAAFDRVKSIRRSESA